MRGVRPASRNTEPAEDPRDSIDDEMWELMNQCWSHEPEARPTCQQILEELERQGVGRLEDEARDTTIPETLAGIGTARVDLNQVQDILDEVGTSLVWPSTK